MNITELKQYKTFFTIENIVFNFVQQKLQNKKHRLYTRDCLPVMYREILNPTNKDSSLKRFPFTTGKPQIGFKQNEVSEEIKLRFKENRLLQQEIMRIIGKRIDEYNYKCGIIKAKTGV